MKTVVFDIDGTLGDCDHRLHHILEKTPKDWDTFDLEAMADTPIEHMVTLARALYYVTSFQVIILTGRCERTREDTERWLCEHGVMYNALHMRSMNDRRPAATVKRERLERLGLSPKHVVTIFDDDPMVAKVLRKAGYHVCAVDDRPYNAPLQEGGRSTDTGRE